MRKQKCQTPYRLHNQRILQHGQEKRTCHRTWSHTHHRQTHCRANLIRRMIKITVNPKQRNTILRKNVRNTRNGTCQTHFRTILIRPTKVTTDASNNKIKAIGKRSYKIMCKSNGKVADDSI